MSQNLVGISLNLKEKILMMVFISLHEETTVMHTLVQVRDKISNGWKVVKKFKIEHGVSFEQKLKVEHEGGVFWVLAQKLFTGELWAKCSDTPPQGRSLKLCSQENSEHVQCAQETPHKGRSLKLCSKEKPEQSAQKTPPPSILKGELWAFWVWLLWSF